MKSTILSALLASLVLSACGHGQVAVTSSAPATLQAMSPEQTLQPPVASSVSALPNLEPTPIHLAPVSQATIRQQVTLRKQAQAAPAAAPQNSQTEAFIDYAAEELAQIRALLAKAQPQVEAEDRAWQAEQAQQSDFRIQSAQGGKDIDIELFLYDARYGKKAKFWGIKNAHDFLMAGRSPMRRWMLKLKLEGLFAPANFSHQILFWVQQADLLRVSGINREHAWLLTAAGITSVPDLARRTNVIEQNLLVLSLKTLALSYGLSSPSKSELEAWVNEAQGLEPIIY